MGTSELVRRSSPAMLAPSSAPAARGARIECGEVGPVLMDGVIIGEIRRVGTSWQAVSATGDLGPQRRSRAGALGDVLAGEMPTSATARPAAPASSLLSVRPDGRLEVLGQTIEAEAARELHVRLGEVLRVQSRDHAAWERLARILDLEWADGVVVDGTGAGERPLRCVLRRADDGGVAARVSRFAIARLSPRRLRDGAMAWRGPIIQCEPDPIVGVAYRASSRRISIPDSVVTRLPQPRLLTMVGPSGSEMQGRDRTPIGRPARMPVRGGGR